MTLFTEELRKCLNAAGLSDCGENDSWNYWYQRVLKAHNDAVERQIATEQSENAKMRELVADMWDFFCVVRDEYDDVQAHKRELEFTIDVWKRMHDLGIEVYE